LLRPGTKRFGGSSRPRGEGGNAIRENRLVETIGHNRRCVWNISTSPFKGEHYAAYPQELCRIPIESCCPPNGTVLDPFSGAGTTCIVAKKLNRNYIGIELGGAYIKLSDRRMADDVGTLF